MNTVRALPLLVVLTAAAGCRAPVADGVDEKFNFLPLARYETTEQPPGYTVDVLWPLIQVQRAGAARSSRALPFWIRSDDGAGERFLDILLLCWQRENERTGVSRRVLFPFFFRKDAPDDRLLHVWPFYGVRRYGGDPPAARTDMVAWPLFEWDRSLAGTRGSLGILSLDTLLRVFRLEHDHVVPPAGPGWTDRELDVVRVLGELLRLAHFERRHVPQEDGPPAPVVDDRLGALLGDAFALYSHQEGEAGTTTRVLAVTDVPYAGLFARVTREGTDGAPGREWNHLFPLWFDSEDATGRSRFLLPLFGRQSRNDGYRRTWIVPPLFSLERDPGRALSAVDVLWPLIRHETRGGDDPLTHLRALPLLWFSKRPQATSQVIVPVYVRIQDEHDEYLHVIPLFGRHEIDDGRLTRTFVLPPLFIETRDQSVHLLRRDVLWPLARFESTAGGSRSWVFPLWFHRRQGARSHLNVLALFDRDTSEVRTSTLLWPLRGRTEALGEGERTSWLPLLDWRFLTGEDPRGSETAVLYPWASFQREGTEIRRWLFPFFWWFDDGVNRSHRHLWPLVGVDENAGMITWSTLFPLFFRGSDADGDHTRTGVLFPFGYAKRTPETSRTWFFPLFYHRATAAAADDGADDAPSGPSARTWVLWPLFSKVERPDGSRLWHSLFHLFRSQHEPGMQEFSILGGVFRNRTQGDRFTSSLAFLYGYENDAGARTLKLFHLVPIRW